MKAAATDAASQQTRRFEKMEKEALYTISDEIKSRIGADEMVESLIRYFSKKDLEFYLQSLDRDFDLDLFNDDETETENE